MLRFLFPIVALTMTLIAYHLDAAAETDFQPIPARQMNPAMLRFLDPVPAITPRHDGLQFGLTQRYSSFYLADDLIKPKNYLADMEIYMADFSASYRNGQHSLQIEWPVLRPLAGSFDPALRQYHQMLGLPNGGRKFRPDNVYGYHYTGPTGGWNSAPQWETGNLNLQWRYSLLDHTPDDADSTLAIASAIKLPTASQSRGWSNGGSDIGLGLTGQQQLNALFFHVEGWWIHPLKQLDYGSSVRDYFRTSLSLGTEIDWLANSIITAQVQGGTSPYQTGISAMDQSPWLIAFGIQLPSDSRHHWNIGFVENLTQNSTQDFGIFAEYQFKNQ